MSNLTKHQKNSCHKYREHLDQTGRSADSIGNTTKAILDEGYDNQPTAILGQPTAVVGQPIAVLEDRKSVV